MFQHAIENVLKGGTHPLPRTGETINDYRFILLSCWKYINQYIPCQTAFCCKSEYSIYNPGEGLPLVITQIYRDVGINNCNDSNDPLCRVICDDYFYRHIKKNILDNRNNSNKMIVSQIQNYIEDNFVFQIESNNFGKVKVVIYDLLGFTIKEKIFIKNIVKQLFTFETDNISNGIYFYNIYLNNNNIYSNKLIINK